MQKLLAPILIVTVLAGCAPKTLSPAGQRAFTATEIAVRVTEFQRATISASDATQIPVEQARTIVTWCVATLEILRTTPAGWDATVRTSWIALKPQLTKFPLLAGWATAIDILLGVS